MQKDFDYYKKWALNVLKKQLKEEKTVSKALSFTENYLEKAYGIGTIRTWKGKRYIKGPDKKWRRYYDKKERGTGIAIAHIMRQINSLEDGDVEGLMKIIQANASRFRDQNGNMLPEVAEIHNLSQKKQETWENKPAKTPEKEPETKREEPPKEEEKPKEPETPKEEDKTKDLKEEVEKWKKQIKYFREDHENGAAHWIVWGSDPHQSVSSKAWGRAKGIRNLIKMRDKLKEEFGLDTPSIPADIMDRFNDYMKEAEGKARYEISADVEKKLSGIKKDKLFDLYNAIEKPLRDKLKEANDAIPKKPEEEFSYKTGLSNKDQADLFTIGKNERGDEVLMYDGKQFDKRYVYHDTLENQKKMIEAVGTDPQKQVAYVRDFLENNPEKVASNWSIDSSYKRYGEKKLKEIVSQSVTPDEEFYNEVAKEVMKKPKSYDSIESLVREHLYKKRVIEYCENKLNGMQKNADQDKERIPVSEAALQQAKDVIGREVSTLLAVAKMKKEGKSVPSYHSTNARQTLADKIRRRARNEPEVCRAMFAYIREVDPEKKSVITSSNSLWDLEATLNDQAKEKKAAGEEETATGEKPLYSNDSGISIVENKDIGRYQIFFPGRPDYETISKLKHSGWHWSPTNGAWQRQNTSNGEYAMKQAAEMLGFEVKKSLFEKTVGKVIEDIFNVG